MKQAPQDKGKLWKIARWATKKAKKELEPDYFLALAKEGRIATSTEDKVEFFHQECFPEPPEVDLNDIAMARYHY